MAHFDYKDKDGKNELNAKGFFYIHGNNFNLGMHTGDGDGDIYMGYIPNHRAALLQLASDILAALDRTEGLPEGFDGFSTNYASASATGDKYDEAGVVTWY